MNKDVKKALDALSEKTARSQATITKAETEAKAVEERISTLKAELDNATTTDQYKDLLREIRDLEDVLAFCKKKVADARENVLTAEEYRAFTSDVNKAFAKIRADYSKDLRSLVDQIISLIIAYNGEVTDLNNALATACTMRHNNNETPAVLFARTIVNHTNPLDPYTAVYNTTTSVLARQKIFHGG